MRSAVPIVAGALALAVCIIAVGPSLTILLVAGLAVIAIAWRKPLLSGGLWWAVVAIVPTWIGIGFAGSQFVMGSVLALVLLFGVLAAPGPRARVNALDVAMMVLIGTMVLALLFDGSRSLANDSIMQWGLPYLLLRFVSLRTSDASLGKMIIGVGLLCAAWAVVEFLFGFHIYETMQLPGSLMNLQEIWQSIQTRAGVARAEGAFGTSISLAGFLALAIPYALQLRLPAMLVTLGILGAGMVCTLARTGAVAAGIMIALILIMRVQKYRPALTVAFLIGALYVAPIVTGTGVNQDLATDFSDSSGYRDYVFATAFGLTVPFGPANEMAGFSYVSVDNAYLRLALDSGQVPAAALVLVFVVALVAYLRYRQGQALVASIAMGASLYVVALITQWQMFIFAVLGIAATEIQRAREARERAAVGLPVSIDGQAPQMVAPGSTRSKMKSAIRR